MAEQARRQQLYDHRLREFVRRTGDITVATDVGVPRSTAFGWLHSNPQTVVSLDIVEMSEIDLQAEVVKLRRRTRTLTAVIGLLLAQLRVSGFRLDRVHVSNATNRAALLRAAERARKVLPLRAVLRALRVSSSRYAAWAQAERGCRLHDQATCPIWF